MCLKPMIMLIIIPHTRFYYKCILQQLYLMTDIKLYRINSPFVVGYNLETNVCIIYSHHNIARLYR